MALVEVAVLSCVPIFVAASLEVWGDDGGDVGACDRDAGALELSLGVGFAVLLVGAGRADAFEST